jgi:hypothetical protein
MGRLTSNFVEGDATVVMDEWASERLCVVAVLGDDNVASVILSEELDGVDGMIADEVEVEVAIDVVEESG